MCGRKMLTKNKMAIIEELLADEWADSGEYSLSYNIAPTHRTPVLRSIGNKRRINNMKWGLIPYTQNSTKKGTLLINARGESILEKVKFKHLVSGNRCIIIASGYYEWKTYAKNKLPYLIKPKDDSLLLMAGLWDTQKNQDGISENYFTIITTAGNQQLARIHYRMPAIIEKDKINIWMDCQKFDGKTAIKLIKPYTEMLECYPVSPIVNSVKNNSPACVQKIATTGDLFDI